MTLAVRVSTLSMARSMSSAKQMHRLSLCCLALIALTQTACAVSCSRQAAPRDSVSHVPGGYYASADGLCGPQLKTALSQLMANHEVFAYGTLWYYYEYTDVVIGTDNQVFDYYSPKTYYFTGFGTAPAGANKEHACPQSWWGGGAACNAYVDLFNVMPSEEKANSAKSHYPLGVVDSKPVYQNARIKVGSSARPEYRGNVFEPCDEFKGDFARVYFYVATAYADAPWGCRESVASTVAFKREEYPTIQPWLLPLLLQWNAADPVSDWEVARNERVFSQQGNRNPFIDYPQLAEHIWGAKSEVPFHVTESDVNGPDSDGSGGGFFPDDNADPSGTTDPVEDQPIGGEDLIATLLLDEDFSSITIGNDLDNNGSSEQWVGNDNFPIVSAVYQAGGAIKVGSGKKSGELTSRSLGNAADATLVVLVQVKGWTTVEGELLVSISGQPARPVAYTRTMSEGYETIALQFTGCQAQSQLTIATSSKRAFIAAVRVGTASVGDQAIHQVLSDAPTQTYCNLMGQPVATGHRGLVLASDNAIRFLR